MSGISEERLAQKYAEEPNEIDRAVINQLKLSAKETDGFVKGMTDIACDVCEHAVELIERHDKTIEQLWIQGAGYRAEQEALQAEIRRLRSENKELRASYERVEKYGQILLIETGELNEKNAELRKQNNRLADAYEKVLVDD